jgi:cytochrome oxidase Cu insertion factor (SCO1/SenC/PrrC family)
MKWRITMLLMLLPSLAASQQHHAQTDEPQVLAPGYSALTFPAPVAGSYRLPALGGAADGDLLDSAGSPATLHDLYNDKIIVLSFVYTSCTDVNGCPLASFVLGLVQRRLSLDDELKSKVRLVTVSFDPLNDSPQVMADYARNFRRGDVDWRFLTAVSETSLQPILDDYNQSVIRDRTPDGQLVGTMSHILRVYLIDAQKIVRNIYSPSFLHPDILLADIRTVTEN